MLRGAEFVLPPILHRAGKRATYRYVEFFTAEIRNLNTRLAYYRALTQFFGWLEDCYPDLGIHQVNSIIIAHYIEIHPGSALTRNQHLSAIKSLFRWLQADGVIVEDPAVEVRGVKHRAKQGKTPVLSDEEMVQLLSSIDTSNVMGLRDRALIATMFFSFARIGAVLGMNVGDYFPKGKRYWFRLHEKGGKYHELPTHHTAEEYLDQYLDAARLRDMKDNPLFQTAPGRSRKLSGKRLQRQEAWAMVKRRALAAGVSTEACNHTFRASGITNFLRNGGSRDNAQKIAAHEDIRTTALYDRRDDEVSLDEIEKIRI
ncbi:tyrosine-type recombinase/integrase [Leptolyngbya iicbica]|uniref:Integrase n=2 Tax=Cyanophyceae TaxID=3028117 RepID=A0A4Q7E9Y6_9CYAN|nr:tyrosine-type recombinase/integrase [Leptolyngbya sp. LK]RZM77815.1 integrase [Leptolyngbya sp. LK]